MKGTKRIHNHRATIHKADHFLPGQIERLKERAEGQEKRIARFFFNHPDKHFGPCQVHKAFFPDAPNSQEWDIISTRRAMTNLTDDDILVKTTKRIPTHRGGTENQWRWKKPEDFPIEQGDMFQKSKPRHTGAFSQ